MARERPSSLNTYIVMLRCGYSFSTGTLRANRVSQTRPFPKPGYRNAGAVRLIDRSSVSAPEKILVTGNVRIAGRRTSIRLESALWSALDVICTRENLSKHELCSKIAASRQKRTSVTSAIRAYIVKYLLDTMLDGTCSKCQARRAPE